MDTIHIWQLRLASQLPQNTHPNIPLTHDVLCLPSITTLVPTNYSITNAPSYNSFLDVFPMVFVNIHPFMALNTKIKSCEVSDDFIGCGRYDLVPLQLDPVRLRLVLKLQRCHELFQI